MRRALLLVLLAAAWVACRSGPDEASLRERRELAAAPEHAPTQGAASESSPSLAEAGGLQYLELITGGAAADDTLPMIVAIHGLGDDPRGFVELLSGFDRPARVILPRAIDAWEGGGWSWFPLRARDQDVAALAAGITHAADLIAQSVRELQRTRPTVGKPIVMGFSQGGMLSFALAVGHPELFSAAYPVGGWLPPPLWPESVDDPSVYPPIVALHGEADPAVLLDPTRQAVAKLQALGLSVQIHVYPGVEHSIPPTMREELHRLLRDAQEHAAKE